MNDDTFVGTVGIVILTFPLLSGLTLLTDVTVPVFVVYPAPFVKSLVSVGTVILAVTLLLALAVNVFTVVPFF